MAATAAVAAAVAVAVAVILYSTLLYNRLYTITSDDGGGMVYYMVL